MAENIKDLMIRRTEEYCCSMRMSLRHFRSTSKQTPSLFRYRGGYSTRLVLKSRHY